MSLTSSLAVAVCLLLTGSTTSPFILAQKSAANNSPPSNPCGSRSGTVPHESYCDKYWECASGNVSRVRDCPNGMVYTSGGGRAGRGGNQLFSNCEYDFNVDCTSRPNRTFAAAFLVVTTSAQKKGTEQINPCDVKGKIVGDVTYCDRYWECVNGQPELYDCPNGLAFAGRNRGVADGCDYPWRGNYCEGKQLANPPIGTDHCDWLYGIFGHETSCTRYWTCWNGTATEQLCIGGLLYNEDTHACDWPENVPGCQKHPLCKDDPNGNVPLGKSCNRYWQCQGGYPRLQRCPAMLVFDKKSLRCVVPPTEDCDIPSTTPPPPEEEEEQKAPQQQQQQRPRQQQQQQQQQQSRPAAVQASQLRQSETQQRPESSRNVPVYVIHEVNSNRQQSSAVAQPAASSSEEDYAGGNRQL